MAEIFTIALIWSTIRLATPLILAALGGMFSERAGIINIALEGMMLAGAFTAAAVTYAAGNPFVGLVAGVAAGMLIAAIHALACIRYKADQVVTGTAINILMLGLPAFLSGAFFLSSGSTPQIPKDHLIPWTPIVIAFVLVPLNPAALKVSMKLLPVTNSTERNVSEPTPAPLAVPAARLTVTPPLASL